MKAIKIFMALLFVSQMTFAQDDESKLEINGYGRTYLGVLANEPQNYSIFQNTVNMEFKKQNDKIGFYANPYVYQYPKGDLQFGLREMYIDLFSDKLDVRIGKQQIIWGQADGVFITDIVSPKDLTEFLLRDFSEIRIGVTAANLNYYFNDENSLQLVWIPAFQSTIFPEEGSIWKPKMQFPLPVIEQDFTKESIPLKLENSEFFAKYSLNAASIDLSLMGGYTWDDDPAMHINKIIDPATMHPKGIKLTPEHHRLSLAGMSFSTSVMDFVLRGEGAYYFDKHFNTQDPSATDALIEKDYINYVIGLDKTIGDWRLSGQFIQQVIMDYDDLIMQDQYQNLATFLLSKSLFREKVRLEWFTYYGFNNEDALSRIRVFYMPYDALSFELGTNIFIGDKGMFGQYNNNDMIYTRVKYNF
jgi:hypothetical protein